MASQHHPSVAAPAPVPQVAASHIPPPRASNAPPGTFAPGTKVQVGQHRVVIEKYLSEGGFAHVYVVKVPLSGGKTETAVLKRVAVPDKETLANMRTEVETMKRLKGHRHIVTYIDSHASQLKGGGYEVFLLMEYCDGGGLIDFMNTRLQNRLTEPEILKIFSDVAEGVASMHYLKPPLLHRDLKVENVLITKSSSSRTYKVCDFGSAAQPRPAATTAQEGRLIEDDVQRHTTMQYRSPEMIDVYRRQPIDEKSDIWALGVLLYKLCYYTTPFEDQGQMAILNASYKYPNYPVFSDRIKKLIASMLRENPKSRPNIYQVIVEVCAMRGADVPVKDIYAHRTQSEVRRNQELPAPSPNVSSPPPSIGLQKADPVRVQQPVPEVTPGRRGRLPPPAQQQQRSARPSPSPARGTSADPFAALDNPSQPIRAAAVDELSNRFPSLDEFSILHDKGSKFNFEPSSAPAEPVQENLNKRVTDALADEAFAQPSAPKNDLSSRLSSTAGVSRSTSLRKDKAQDAKVPQIASPPAISQPAPQRPSYTSTGTMTSPTPPQAKSSDVNRLPIWRVPKQPSGDNRAFSQPRPSESAVAAAASLKPNAPQQRPELTELHRSRSQTHTRSSLNLPRSPASSRPSLEGQRPAAFELSKLNDDFGDALSRSKSANSRNRPSGTHVESNLDFLRDKEKQYNRRGSSRGASLDIQRPITTTAADFDPAVEPDDRQISSDMDFLRKMESEDSSKKRHHRRVSSGGPKHVKRSSMPSISLSKTKHNLAGKFGDAFRRFEGNANQSGPKTPEPQDESAALNAKHELTPIAGSEATGSTRDDDDLQIDETEDLSPEVRREMEKRLLEQEERRVEAAAAEYRKRMAAGGKSASGGGSAKASTIQNRVRNLLDDADARPGQKTAEGYGRFTKEQRSPEDPQSEHARSTHTGYGGGGSLDRRLGAAAAGTTRVPLPSQQQLPKPHTVSLPASLSINTRPPASASPASQRTGPTSSARPVAPPKPSPKPVALRTGGGGPGGLDKQLPAVPTKPGQLSPSKSRASASMREVRAGLDGAAPEEEDWERDFSKRYPSLSGLEMVERQV
ncbi:hypothetical protein EV356DRAFT_569649 [Viridothelium virens]|uniref:non-specific serine/threonine protein kinase n=1 Tax=Viridothelium virens TaxID=1048519 RepID=A0A6A6GZU3_VIRVR|nr:hypothetical protein EV356DRAFT_569649 [Viridothelium virens]